MEVIKKHYFKIYNNFSLGENSFHQKIIKIHYNVTKNVRKKKKILQNYDLFMVVIFEKNSS